MVHDELRKAQRILRDLFAWCAEDGPRLAARFEVAPGEGEPLVRAVTDFISGMTDRFAMATWSGGASAATPVVWAAEGAATLRSQEGDARRAGRSRGPALRA